MLRCALLSLVLHKVFSDEINSSDQLEYEALFAQQCDTSPFRRFKVWRKAKAELLSDGFAAGRRGVFAVPSVHIGFSNPETNFGYTHLSGIHN